MLFLTGAARLAGGCVPLLSNVCIVRRQKTYRQGVAWLLLAGMCSDTRYDQKQYTACPGLHVYNAPACHAPYSLVCTLQSFHDAFLQHQHVSAFIDDALHLLCRCLQMETVVLYSSREERQHWHIPTITSSAAPAAASTSGRNASSNGNEAAGSGSDQQLAQGSSADDTDDDDSGGSFWLPGGAVVTLRMVNHPAHGADADSDSSGSSSDGGRGHRGLLIGLHMLDAGGSALFVEREYSPQGELFEVRQGTAVKGGWSGGRM